MEPKHDQALLQILKEERNITNFLDAFFGFMYRCTDFYIDSSADQKLGFPPGVAEDLVLRILHKWKRRCDISRDPVPEIESTNSEVPEVVEEVEIRTEISSQEDTVSEYVAPVQPSDSYNGAIREDYTWSQTISDVDVLVNVPEYVRKAKDLRVEITADRIRVAARTETLRDNKDLHKYERLNSEPSDWSFIFDGELSFKTQREESIWCIVPGKYVNIHLEKATERWWEALIKGEAKIELSKIDCSRPIDDLGLNEQMKVQELMWNHQQKLMGKPTSDQISLEKVLKKAWNADGSPFKGSEYDPSVLNFN